MKQSAFFLTFEILVLYSLLGNFIYSLLSNSIGLGRKSVPDWINSIPELGVFVFANTNLRILRIRIQIVHRIRTRMLTYEDARIRILTHEYIRIRILTAAYSYSWIWERSQMRIYSYLRISENLWICIRIYSYSFSQIRIPWFFISRPNTPSELFSRSDNLPSTFLRCHFGGKLGFFPFSCAKPRLDIKNLPCLALLAGFR